MEREFYSALESEKGKVREELLAAYIFYAFHFLDWIKKNGELGCREREIMFLNHYIRPAFHSLYNSL